MSSSFRVVTVLFHGKVFGSPRQLLNHCFDIAFAALTFPQKRKSGT
jgi:hypothetical protein